LESTTKQLKGITSRPVWQEGEQILSVPDAIGKTLSRYMNEDFSQQFSKAAIIPDEHIFHKKSDAPNNGNSLNLGICPDCGSQVEHASGCVVCRSCGFSKCG